jgi:hypothetical protein
VKGTLQMPFTNGNDVITENANDAVGFLFDTGATTQKFWSVGSIRDPICAPLDLGAPD